MSHRLRHFSIAMTVLFLNVSLSSQTASTGTAQATAAGPSQAKSTTIVGCLVQGLPDASRGKGTGAAVASPDDYFVRTPTVKVSPGTSVAVGTPGTTSTATAIGTPVEDSFYRVTGLGADQLRPHLGHRVEIQGHLTDNQPGIESTRATTTQDKDGRATTKVETRIAIAGVLHATTIKMISADCQK